MSVSPMALEGAPGALLVIISGPSGVGKDTIIEAMRNAPGAHRTRASAKPAAVNSASPAGRISTAGTRRAPNLSASTRKATTCS